MIHCATRQLLHRGAHFHAQTLLRLFAEEGQDGVIKQPPPPSAPLFSERKKKRQRQPRSLSFGNCGWEGPLGLVRPSGQADSPFPASQAAGSPRKRGTRLSWMMHCAGQGGSIGRNGFTAVGSSFLPPLPSLLPPA